MAEHYRKAGARQAERGPSAAVPDVPAPPNRSLYRALQGLALGAFAAPAFALSLFASFDGLEGRAGLARPLGAVSLAGLTALYLYYVRALRKAALGGKLDVENAAAVRLLDQDPAAALGEFASLVRKSRGLPIHRSVYLLNFGHAAALVGQPGRGLEALTAVHRRGWLSGGPHEVTLLANLITTSLFAGDPAQGRRWVQVAEGRTPASKQALLAFGRALLAARSGGFDECVRVVNDGWHDAYRILNTKSLAALSLLRAFAQAQLDPEGAADAIAAVRATDRHVFSHWSENWPEFDEFVRAHRIGV